MQNLSRGCSVMILLTALLFAATPLLAASDGAVAMPNKGDFATVVRGAKLFQQFCSACHGKRANGPPPEWLPLGASKSRPPALNGNGHAWHHPTPDLIRYVAQGTVAQGGGMPAWGAVLTEKQIVDIISWLQSRWPKDKYEQWKKTDERSR